MESHHAHIAAHRSRDFSFFNSCRASASDLISKRAPWEGCGARSHLAILGGLGRASELAVGFLLWGFVYFANPESRRVSLVQLSSCALCRGSHQLKTPLGRPSTSDFNTPTNWTPVTVPTGMAIFNDSATKTLTFSQDTTVGAMQFSAPNYTFELTSAVHTIAITGVGIQAADPANAPTFNVSFPALEFANSSTAGPAILHAFNTGPIAFLST